MPAKISQKEFIIRCREAHGDTYVYVKTCYVNSVTKIIIFCKIHGDFNQLPFSHSNGIGCPKCGKINAAKKLSATQEEFLRKCHEVHQNKYDYRLASYTNNYTKVVIICHTHGEFLQSPQNHLDNKSGCPQCSFDKLMPLLNDHKRLTFNYFVEKANEIHMDKYDYSLVKLLNVNSPIIIVCKIHGSFHQLAANHLYGHNGCPLCHTSISKGETNWLDTLNIAKENRQYTIKINKKRYVVDGYDPITNTIYEFNGDFWHGNPAIYDPNKENSATKTTFGELYAKTICKRDSLIGAGYVVISIWESDWESNSIDKTNIAA